MEVPVVWSVVAVVTASLAGSIHCVAMCGGFAVSCAGSPPTGASYHLGRLGAYLLLGAVAGYTGDLISAQFAAQLSNAAGVLVGVLLLAQGVSRLWAVVRGGSVSAPRWASIALPRWFMAHGRDQRNDLLRGGLIGLGSGFLPCGWLYSFVLVALGAGSLLSGMAVMFCFWLGTVPSLVAVALGAHQVFRRLGRYAPVVSAVLIMIAGAVSLESHLTAHVHQGEHGSCH